MKNMFSSYRIKNKEIKNRIVMPPMVYFGLKNDDGFVTDEHVKHYEARAAGGTGLIIVEAACVNQDGRLADIQLGIWSDEHIKGLKRIADACHRHGAIVLVQIHHAGFKTPKKVSPFSVSSSEYIVGKSTSRALSIEEIKLLEQDFAKAAKRAKKARFDGVEIHGAHGYLISQFVSPVVNKRNNEYGGTLKNRTKFSVEIIKKIRKETGHNFIIGYRMGGNEPHLEDSIEIAKLLAAAGIDLLHVSAGMTTKEHPVAPVDFPYNWIVFCGTEIKKHVKIPVITVNGIRTPKQAAFLIENELADFVAIGRGLLVDPQWVQKARWNMDIISCEECSRCHWFTCIEKCPRYIKS